MRTLETQMRLRRAIRSHDDFAGRLADASGGELAAAARHRLGELLAGVKESWARESDSDAPEAVRRHVVRSLSGLEAMAATLGLPGSDPGRLNAEFQDAALPLLFVLRGLEASSASEFGIRRTA